MKSFNRTRRSFLGKMATAGVATTGLPIFVPRHVFASPGRPGANERPDIAIIGAGSRGNHMLRNAAPNARIVAVCDTDLSRAEKAKADAEGTWAIYQDYRELLDKERIDGVIHCTNDHNRVLPAIHSCQAGVDVYVEKPFSMYVEEGRALVNAVKAYDRVCQVGTQARTIGTTTRLLNAIRDGEIGAIKSIVCRNYPGPEVYPGGHTAQPIPDSFDWDKWQGPTVERPYNDLLHIHWTRWQSYCSGMVGFLGAHAYDMIQLALGRSDTGPVKIWPTSQEGPSSRIRMRYDDGFEVRLDADKEDSPFVGAIFTGENCKVEINEQIYRTNPPDFFDDVPEQELGEWGGRPGWMGKSHVNNWLDCIKTRDQPNCPAEVGHRSGTICHLVNITKILGRSLQWDPTSEQFVGDEEASKLLSRDRRKGYELPSIG